MKRWTALILSVLSVLMLVMSTGCAGHKEHAYPDDFSFSLVWNCYGDSTYDSKTGKLVKQKAAANVKDYTTKLFFSEAEKEEIFNLISDMDPEAYPDAYNPLIGQSKPNRNIVLTVTYNGKTKTISCMNVSLGDKPDGTMGQKFMKVHDRIVEIICASSEWTALPEYEFFYD